MAMDEACGSKRLLWLLGSQFQRFNCSQPTVVADMATRQKDHDRNSLHP